MITVPAHRVKQFGVEFFQASFSAKDIDRLVKFEVLGYAGAEEPPTAKAKRANRARVNWEVLEKRIGESEAAYQRPVIRRKIDELVAYYRDCKDAGTLPAIPGAVIITSEKRFTFTPMASQHDLGLLQIPEEHGVLRVLDGQHRLLALHALTQAGENLGIEVPAVLFDRLDARQIVELFVTINAKHTRLNPSHIVSLAGRKLYPDPNQALAHDVIRSLNEDETSPLAGEIKMLGTGRGRVSQAPLAEEIVDFLETVEKIGGGARMNELRHGRQALLPELHEGGGGRVPHRVGGAQVLHQDRRRAPRLHPRGARRDGPRARAQARRLRLPRHPRGGEALGRPPARTAASRPRASGRTSSRAARAGRWKR